MRLLEPAEGVFAFYDGRVDGYRFAGGPNWVDDGALSLGIASYAVVCDDHAMVYDTHVSVEHARYVRTSLEARGVRRFTVVLSHWHLDHVAGTAAFGECEIIASRRTASCLPEFKGAIEAGTHEGPPRSTRCCRRRRRRTPAAYARDDYARADPHRHSQ